VTIRVSHDGANTYWTAESFPVGKRKGRRRTIKREVLMVARWARTGQVKGGGISTVHGGGDGRGRRGGGQEGFYR